MLKREACKFFLGIYVDEHLQWNEHKHNCRVTLISVLYAISEIKSVVPISTLNTVYFSLAYPHLLYGILLWGGTYNIHTASRLRSTQKTILYIGPQVWNWIYNDIKCSPCFKIFCSKFRKQLLGLRCDNSTPISYRE